jgi:hypothetical protein
MIQMMININGKLYNEPIAKGLPYYRVDNVEKVAYVLPYSATKYSNLKEHKVSLNAFYARDVMHQKIIINSNAYNRLEMSTTSTGGKRLSFPTYIMEGFGGPGYMYDHRNNDETDDTTDNLRPVTATQNSYNKKIAKNNTSGYKGIMRTKSKVGKADTWTAILCCGGQHHTGLTYKNKLVAALAYNELAKTYHGEFAGLNKVTVEMIFEVYQDSTTRASLIKDLAKLDKRFGTGWSNVLIA